MHSADGLTAILSDLSIVCTREIRFNEALEDDNKFVSCDG